MTKKQIVFLIGAWVLIFPFLGFPTSWKKILLILTGLLLMWIGYGSKVVKYHPRPQEHNIVREK